MRPWVVLTVLLLVLILGPFFLFEQRMTSVVDRLVVPHASKPAVAAAIVSLLALDVFLPVPSSILSTAAGALLGFAAGLLASTVGMSLGCTLAYGLSRRFGPSLVQRFVTAGELQEVAARFRGSADWAVAMMRPIPVLAEASALFAPVAGMPFPRYLLVTTLANLGISAVYAAAGAHALRIGSFLLAFAAAIALPGCAMLVRRVLRRRGAAIPVSRAPSGSRDSR